MTEDLDSPEQVRGAGATARAGGARRRDYDDDQGEGRGCCTRTGDEGTTRRSHLSSLYSVSGLLPLDLCTIPLATCSLKFNLSCICALFHVRCTSFAT